MGMAVQQISTLDNLDGKIGHLNVFSEKSTSEATKAIQLLVEFVTYNGLNDVGIKFSKVHLLRLEKAGKFPKRIYLSPGRVAWIKSEIIEYQARCIALRNASIGDGL